MDKKLHIFCSKEAQTTFKESNIQGDSLLFKENLLEGPIISDVFSDEFWSKRYEYFENTYQVSRVDYFDNAIKSIVQLEDLGEYKEVVLWLDYTNLSQVNLMAIGSHLSKYFSKNTQFFLVCSGKHKGRNELQKLTDYNSKEFEILYSYKVKLTLPNLEYLQQCWEAYSVKNNTFNYSLFSNKFRYLQQAING